MLANTFALYGTEPFQAGEGWPYMQAVSLSEIPHTVSKNLFEAFSKSGKFTPDDTEIVWDEDFIKEVNPDNKFLDTIREAYFKKEFKVRSN